jgi:hypothetical protein
MATAKREFIRHHHADRYLPIETITFVVNLVQATLLRLYKYPMHCILQSMCNFRAAVERVAVASLGGSAANRTQLLSRPVCHVTRVWQERVGALPAIPVSPRTVAVSNLPTDSALPASRVDFAVTRYQRCLAGRLGGSAANRPNPTLLTSLPSHMSLCIRDTKKKEEEKKKKLTKLRVQ